MQLMSSSIKLFMTNRWSWEEALLILMSFSVLELWLVTLKFFWQLSVWNSNRIWYNFHLTFYIKIFLSFDLCLWRMSVYEISTVTVLVGLTSVTAATTGLTPTPASSVVQMTRRISRVVIHSGYNAATYVSYHVQHSQHNYAMLLRLWDIWFTFSYCAVLWL